MALIGSINEQGELQGQINGARYLTGVITNASAVGGQVVGMRGLKGDKGDKGDTGDTGATGADGQDGADGFSPSASVSKVGDTTTIIITDKDGTTTASVYDGKDDVFVAVYGESSFAEVQTAIVKGQQIYLSKTAAGYSNYYPVSVVQSGGAELDLFYISRTGFLPASTSVVYHASVTSSDVWSFEDYPLQPKLVSGTSIKTINNTSLLGSGNIDIQGGGASAFIAEYGVTSYSDVKDAYDEDAIILCKSDDSGNTAILQLAYFDDANDGFIFTEPTDDGWRWTSIVSDDTWDDGSFQFASTDTATQLRDGLMSALDWQKLDGIASGAEVNVQSDWNEADATSGAYIANKPTIPEDKVFVATYGTTTFAELLDAYNAKKVIYLKRAGTNFTYYYPVSVNPGTSPISNFFLYFTSGNRTISRATLTSGNSWSISSYALQDELVSGTNIKTINNESLLGSGDITVAAGGTPIPTADEVSEFDSDAHMNSTDMTTGADSELEDFIDGLNVSGGSAFLDMFYPVGSYYETSDSTFDPNVKWGGTWSLETSGQVHVSAGTGYTIGSTGGSETVTLTTNQIPSHGHSTKGEYVYYDAGSKPGTVLLWGTGTASVQNAGGGQAHNNMQPYIVVNRWHRTA